MAALPGALCYPSGSPHGRILCALTPVAPNHPMITILLLLALHAPRATAMNDDVLLKARYLSVEGTDPEYGQGAIERNDLRHHPMPHFEWLILVEGPADTAGWQAKLNAAVDPKNGSFVVECASAEQEAAMREGKITMQR